LIWHCWHTLTGRTRGAAPPSAWGSPLAPHHHHDQRRHGDEGDRNGDGVDPQPAQLALDAADLGTDPPGGADDVLATPKSFLRSIAARKNIARGLALHLRFDPHAAR
jgi:hypothetical protein